MHPSRDHAETTQASACRWANERRMVSSAVALKELLWRHEVWAKYW